MRARKLISRTHLHPMYHKFAVGVPVRKIHADADLTMSIPTFTTLLDTYKKYLEYLPGDNSNTVAKTLNDSLFPEWLDEEVPGAQEQPSEWKYVGQFPVGAWIKR